MLICYLFNIAFSLQLEYRFGLDYGDNFIDYSGNNNHGLSNSLGFKGVVKTDRGIYTAQNLSRVISTNHLDLLQEFSVLIWCMPTNTHGRLFFLTNDNNQITVELARNNTINTLYTITAYNSPASKNEYNASFTHNTWFLIIFTCSNSTLSIYLNTKFYTITINTFPDYKLYAGIGALNNTRRALPAFIWILRIYSKSVFPSKFIYEIGTKLGASCASPELYFKDHELGKICLSNNTNPNMTSYEDHCSSCSTLINFTCPYTDRVCSYNPNSNTCSSTFLSNSSKEPMDCTCREEYFSINNQCCNKDCKSCNNQAKCLSCIDDNKYLIKGTCLCKKSFNLNISSNECEKCGENCEICNETYCTTCYQNFITEDLKNCFCPDQFYQTIDGDCLPCNFSCQTCNNPYNCISCKEEKSFLNIEGICLVYCGPEKIDDCTRLPELCKESYLNSTCYKCVENSYLVNGNCSCVQGYEYKNESCTEIFFYWFISVNNKNLIKIQFSEEIYSESLKNFTKFFTDHEIQVLLTAKSSTTFLISPNISINNSTLLLIQANNEFFYSKSNHKLFNSSYSIFLQKLNEINENSALNSSIKFISSLSFSVSLASNPSGFWALLNTFQFISFMPLNSVKYPKKLKDVSSGLINYNFLPNLFEIIFDSNCTSAPYNKAQEFGIKSSVYLINTGKNYAALIVFLVINAGKIFYFWIRKNDKKIEMNKEKCFNLILMFWVQMFIETGIYGVVQMKSEIKDFIPGYLNTCLAVINFYLIAYSPFIILIYLLPVNTSNQAVNINSKSKLSFFIEDLNSNPSLLSTLYYPISLIRKLSFILIQTVFINYPLFQASSNFAISISFLIYLAWTRPFKDNLINGSFIIGEICVSSVFAAGTVLAFDNDDEVVDFIESFCIYTIFSCAGIQTFIGVVEFFRGLRGMWLDYEKKRALNFVRSLKRRDLRE